METTHQPEEEQRKLWNGVAGNAWVETQQLLDGVFRPFENLLADAVAAQSPGRVLDIGCGSGSTTVAAARRLGANANCVGIDISEPMIRAAQARAERAAAQATFICANAQSYPFQPAGFDMLISRFGVMFFDDPVQAFSNLRGAASPGAELRFIAWRSPAENPFMTTAERAAAPLLPHLPPRVPDAPGQFAFARQQHVHRILDESGWRNINIQPLDVTCSLPEEHLVDYFTKLGPLSLALPQADEPTRTQVIDTVRSAFAPFVHGSEVHFTAACWLVTSTSK